MKQRNAIVFTVLLLVLFLSGCKANEEKILSDYQELLINPTSAAEIRQTQEYLWKFIPKVNRETATGMVSLYEEYLSRYIKENPEKTDLEELYIYFDEKTGRIDEEKIKDSELVSFYQNLITDFFMIAKYEGNLVLRINYTALLAEYEFYIDEPLTRLYQLAANVTEYPITEDAKLQVSFEILLDRAYEAETILVDYPDNEMIKTDALWIFTSHLNAILMGSTNSPIFDYATGEFSTRASGAYIAFLQDHPDSTVTWVIKEYYSYLNSIKFQLSFSDKTASKVFFDTCDWLVTEAEKRVQN